MAEEFTGPVIVSGQLSVQPVRGKLPLKGPDGELKFSPPIEVASGELTCELLTVTGSPTSQKFEVFGLDSGPPAAKFKDRVEIDGSLDVDFGIDIKQGGITVRDGGIDLRSGDITLRDGDLQLIGADCAEDFDVDERVDSSPGSVMVIGAHGVLEPCSAAYDSRAVGVVSGAGLYKPAVRLDRAKSERKRAPIGLLGKVFCKVDAHFASIEVGDLLTTSQTIGHAMKVSDRGAAIGATVGKALAPLPSGRGVIPILIVLQ